MCKLPIFDIGLAALVVFALACTVRPASAQNNAATLAAWPVPHEADAALGKFTFQDRGELPNLSIHYRTLGSPQRGPDGHIDNAVLVLHGTGGAGTTFLRPQFAGVLFTKGGVLDAARWFIIIPDSIGHGKSSKPSDGLRTKFPHYTYDDMVRAEYRLVSEALHVDHLRLIIGTSMGCMHGFVWGETYPGFVDGLMALACNPVQIAGRNRLWRQMIIDGIISDPAWAGGNYKTQPMAGLRYASDILLLAGSAPLVLQTTLPTRDAADAFLEHRHTDDLASLDANDLLYSVASSRNYDPSAGLGRITARVMWVNTADDFINPPELGIAEGIVHKMPHAQFVLLPISAATSGHGSHTLAALWLAQLKTLIASLPPS